MRMSIMVLLVSGLLLSGCVGPVQETAAPPHSPALEQAPSRTSEDALRRHDAALELVAQAPNDPAALRDALDQVALGLVDAPPGPLRIELAALADQLAGQLREAVAPVQAAEPATPKAAPASSQAVAVARPAAVVRPTQPPAFSTFAVSERRSFEGSGVSNEYAGCIDVQVLGRNGPLPGAVIGINNGDLNYQNQTDANGYSGRCGLGASTWSVVLFWTPAAGEVRNSATTVYLSGSGTQRAAVVFREQ